MAKRSDVRITPRHDAVIALAKCREFTEAAQNELGACRWDSAGLSAIHAGIAAADAALIASAGVRSISRDHGAVLSLLEDQVPEYSAGQRRQLAGLIKMKNQVAYEQRMLEEIEARQLVDHATRLSQWAARVVAAHL